MDHPVLVTDLEQRVHAVQTLPMEPDLNLVVGELLALVGSAVPDPHRARAVFTLRDVAMEVQILERMVLGPDRHPVVLGRGRNPVRYRPRREYAIALEAQVPMDAASVVLLDHVAR